MIWSYEVRGFIWTSDIYDENNAMAFMCTANSWGFCAIPKNSKCNVILCEKWDK